MALSDDDRRKLAEGLADLSDEALGEVKQGLDTLLGELQDTNSQFPETKKFLASRGLTHVKQLDRRGVEDLKAHLQAVLRGITN